MVNFVSFVANLLRYLCAKNYENTMRFDKVIAIRVQFFGLTVYMQCVLKKDDKIQ